MNHLNNVSSLNKNQLTKKYQEIKIEENMEEYFAKLRVSIEEQKLAGIILDDAQVLGKVVCDHHGWIFKTFSQ